MKCSACGAVGHMRSNKFCPKYNETLKLFQSGQLQPEPGDAGFAPIDEENLINVDGTKIKFSKQLVQMYALLHYASSFLLFFISNFRLSYYSGLILSI